MLKLSTQITIPLDIPNVSVIEVTTDENGAWHIKVETDDKTTKCGICQQEIVCQHGVNREIELRHLPILGKATYIHIQPKRAKCPFCSTSPTTTQTVEWYRTHSPHTEAYDNYLMRQLKGSTVMDVSQMENVGYDAVLGALERQLPVEVDWSEINDLGTIGIDEVSISKGRKGYRAIITGRQKNGQLHVLAVLPERKKKR